jgi:tRNA1(Val) A37 N6-methylase TrmN6
LLIQVLFCLCAAGDADEVVSVDLSKTYLSWAERNMKQNGFTDEGKYKFSQSDVKQYLQTISPDILISLFLIRQLLAIANVWMNF